MSCKTISNLVHRAALNYDDTKEDYDEKTDNNNDGTKKTSSLSEDYADGRYYSMKRLDKLSTSVLKNALKFTGTVNMMVPTAQMEGEQPHHHQPGTLVAYDDHYLACLDPLDGSGNADASICTGTVFGIFRREDVGDDEKNKPLDETTILQPARNMRAAGYCLYSSATVLVFTFSDGVYGFTLDPQIQEFVLTHDNLTIPDRGTVYSCNEANSEGWRSEGWKPYLKTLKLGTGETQTRYAHRYVGSMVGDIHRTLLYGGIFAYPSAEHKPYGNLQLLYKTAPMAFVLHHAGGKALDEEGNNLLDKRPERIHQKSPCFMGSPGDVDELRKYLVKSSSEEEEEKKEESE
jgi:fructose-1,6-bisphosphatase I